MTTERPLPTNHHHAFNYHTGRPRFHFEEPPPPPPPPPPPAPAWHDGVAPEVKGFWQIKGIPLDDPKAASSKLTELYQQAEKFIGVPPAEIIRIPKADAAPADLRAYYERLGAPKEAKDYDLSTVTDSTIADGMRSTMHEKGVPKDVAAAIAASVAKGLTEKTSQQNAVDTAKLADQKANLQKNWGDKFAYNHLQAIEGARKLGISQEAVKGLEGVIGYDQIMEAMRKIGANTREDTFLTPPGGQPGEVTTVAGAQARKTELMADNAWVTRYNNGGVPERREMDRLNTMIVGAM